MGHKSKDKSNNTTLFIITNKREVITMSDYVAHKVYDNIPGYNGIPDNIIDGTETINVQRWKYEAQLEWIRNNTTQEDTIPGGDSTPSVSGGESSSNKSLWDTLMTGNVIGLDALHSGNGSNLRSLKRMEIIYKDLDFKFAVNPSDYTQKEPNRVTVTQTKGGAWIDAWGAGIVEFNIKGITGVFGKKFTAAKDNYFTKIVNTTYDVARVISGDSGVDVGYQRWKELRDLFRAVYKAVEDGEEVKDLVQFYNFTDNEYWYCYPSPAGIELYRSKSKPHVYQYTINLLGLRRIGEPAVSTGVIGNPNTEQTTNNSPTGVTIDTESSGTGSTVQGGAPAEGGELVEAPGEVSNENGDTTTQTNPQSTIQGGNAYVTKAAATYTQADVTTITNTRTKNNETIRSQSKEYADLLSPIIGGSNGLLVPTTAYNVSKEISITSLGVVLNLNGFTKDNLLQGKNLIVIPNDRLTQEIQFLPTVSSDAYNVWKQIRDYSPEILDSTILNYGGLTPTERIIKTVKTSNYYGSTLFEYILQYRTKYYITKTDIKYLKTIMIDTIAVYLNLYKIYSSVGQLTSSITLENITNLIRNIESLILYFEFNSTDENVFYIQNIKFELRQLETILHQVKSDVIEYL